MDIGKALTVWADAMSAQTDHEAICEPCFLNGAPVCDEGRRLQQAARDAHEAWVSDQYAGRAVAIAFLDDEWGPDSAAQLLERGPR